MFVLLASFATAGELHELGDHAELPPGSVAYTAAALVNLRAAWATDAPIARRLGAGTRVRVVEQVGDRVEVTVGGTSGWIARELLSTMGRTADLDADGTPERIVVTLDEERRPVAWLREGGAAQRVTLYDDTGPYLGDWALVSAEESGVPLLRVSVGQDACGAQPTTWLSYQDGRLQPAISVMEVADGMYSVSVDVRFPSPGVATLHVEEREEGELLTAEDERCALIGGVFACS